MLLTDRFFDVAKFTILTPLSTNHKHLEAINSPFCQKTDRTLRKPSFVLR